MQTSIPQSGAAERLNPAKRSAPYAFSKRLSSKRIV